MKKSIQSVRMSVNQSLKLYGRKCVIRRKTKSEIITWASGEDLQILMCREYILKIQYLYVKLCESVNECKGINSSGS